MLTPYEYRFNRQFERYVQQFMRAFSGYQVRQSSTTQTLHRVPVRYGTMERLIATVLQRRDSYTNTAIPLIAVNMTGITPNVERKVSHHHEENITLGDEPGQYTGARKINGPAFILEFDVSIYADSQTQMFEILEQILLVFNPRITIQVDNSVLNSDYITEIELQSINNEIQYPLGADQQVVMQSMTFNVPVRLHYPHYEGGGVIEEIRARIFDNTNGTNVLLASWWVYDTGLSPQPFMAALNTDFGEQTFNYVPFDPDAVV